MRKICLGLMLTFIAAAFQLSNCFAQNKPVFSIPFTLVDNRPFIEVKIKQHTFHFILDCGADYGLDTKTAHLLNQKLGHQSMMGGAGASKVTTWTTTVDSAKIGPINVLKESFLVVDISEVKNKLHLPYLDGFIGYTFMKDYAVQFDYPHKVINFYKTYNGINPIAYTMYDGSVPKFKVKIDGKPAIVIVDTGDRTSFTLFDHYAIKTGIKTNYKLSDTTITGYGMGGPIYARTFTLKQMQAGTLLITHIPARIPMLKTGAFSDTSIDGSIDGGVLKGYKFTIDYKNQKVYFE